MSTGRVLVAVVNYRSHEHVAALLRSLADDPPDQALIVDNGSGGEEPAALDRVVASFDFATAVVASENRGFGAGVNVAVARLEPTDGDVIWILNPDTEVPSGTVAALRNALADGWDVVSPQIITGGAEHPVVWFGGGDVDLRRGRTQHRRLGDPFAPAESLAPVACSFITGAAPMFTARAWRELGGLREDLFLYWEDADMSLRATGRGLRMAVVPGAVVWHARGGSSDDGHHSSVYYFYMQRNRMLVLRESGVSRGRLLLGPGGIETLRWSLRPLTEPRGRGGKLLASAKGLVAGLSAKITAKVPAAK